MCFLSQNVDVALALFKISHVNGVFPFPECRRGPSSVQNIVRKRCVSFRQKADVALAPFQMSAERSTVVDFTKPFMTKGTTVVVRRPEQHLWIFQFLSPLSRVVWSAIFLSFIVVSLTLFGVSRVNSDR